MGTGRFLTVQEVADELGVSARFVYRHARAMGAVHLGTAGGPLRIERKRLEQWIAERQAATEPIRGAAASTVAPARNRPISHREASSYGGPPSDVPTIRITLPRTKPRTQGNE